MKLIPGKLYRTKKDMWFYESHNSGGKYASGICVMFLGTERDWDPDEVLHIYFLVGHEKLHFDSYRVDDLLEEYGSPYFEELT